MNEMMTYLGIIISVLSILVAALICWQIFSLIKLEIYRKEIKSIVDNSIKDYNYTVSAIIHQLNGILHSGLPDKDLNVALESFIEAINELNSAKNKEPLDGIVEHIEYLITENRNLINLSNNDKNKYVDVCKKCSESKKLIKLLDKLNISQNQSNIQGDNIQGIDVKVNKYESNKN